MWSMVNCLTIFFSPLIYLEGLEYVASGVTILFSLLYPIFFYSSFIKEGLRGFFKAILINEINHFLSLIFFVILAVFTFYDIEAVIMHPHSNDLVKKTRYFDNKMSHEFIVNC